MLCCQLCPWISRLCFLLFVSSFLGNSGARPSFLNANSRDCSMSNGVSITVCGLLFVEYYRMFCQVRVFNSTKYIVSGYQLQSLFPDCECTYNRDTKIQIHTEMQRNIDTGTYRQKITKKKRHREKGRQRNTKRERKRERESKSKFLTNLVSRWTGSYHGDTRSESRQAKGALCSCMNSFKTDYFHVVECFTAENRRQATSTKTLDNVDLETGLLSQHSALQGGRRSSPDLEQPWLQRTALSSCLNGSSLSWSLHTATACWCKVVINNCDFNTRQ